jgi:hypothetical protein
MGSWPWEENFFLSGFNGLAERDFQLSELQRRSVCLLKAHCVLQLGNDRIKWAIEMMRGALVTEGRVRLLTSL